MDFGTNELPVKFIKSSRQVCPLLKVKYITVILNLRYILS